MMRKILTIMMIVWLPTLLVAQGNKTAIYYRITGVGEKALAEELERLQRIVSMAQELKLLPKNFGYHI